MLVLTLMERRWSDCLTAVSTNFSRNKASLGCEGLGFWSCYQESYFKSAVFIVRWSSNDPTLIFQSHPNEAWRDLRICLSLVDDDAVIWFNWWQMKSTRSALRHSDCLCSVEGVEAELVNQFVSPQVRLWQPKLDDIWNDPWTRLVLIGTLNFLTCYKCLDEWHWSLNYKHFIKFGVPSQVLQLKDDQISSHPGNGSGHIWFTMFLWKHADLSLCNSTDMALTLAM